ncbi:chromosomal replication initiator protein DnaA [Candidatus Liberibacter asiaticus]|uniref:Chromosomal replication initiator protein DnaA n=2 Tax=Liberibacter asiaticus TaxID=34021 RepID=C6XFE7_LIBAP|nr:chromosomal replication initiator protein DnaA [Candidatus Liberibacter asiaticus]ACT57100.1 chromosomal replication initiation protein [Candidatus Liberibacter asiaticus str. psy62]AGH16935.1 chromosomal replication initiation protein [Candidatus Liberibacter asiaticus str. gxpsy]ALK07274.1 chromosomal replication initiator protein DnaA [Candidatus Liberibacter asiaticus]ASK52763.1 chromosomal replication initiation protein DnaA [Candidatus Liberibacter asiaticus]AWL14082.1 chromosomal rep
MQLREVAACIQENDVEIAEKTPNVDVDKRCLEVNCESIFTIVSSRLKNQVGPDVYASWFQRLKFHSVLHNIVHLSVPTNFLKAWIKNRYLETITKLFQEEHSRIQGVEILVRSVALPSVEKTASSPSITKLSPINTNISKSPIILGKQTISPVFGSPLDSRFVFSTFIEGSSNRVALTAAQSIAEVDSHGYTTVRLNPLFIHASVGLGKTHLLQAIANASIKRQPNLRVVYLTAEYFMWRFASAIRDNCALNLKDSLRNIDLLLIDDMQFLQGKLIQHEFCHLLNSLLDSAKQVVAAADRPPSELESLDPRIRSRLQGGVSVPLGLHDYEMRFSILKNRLAISQKEDPKLNINEEVLMHVARTVTTSGRELDGAFNQLVFRHSFAPILTAEIADELLSHLVNTGETKKMRIEDIQRMVAKHYNISRNDLLSNRRVRTVVRPRQVAMYLSKIMTPRSFPEIGRRFGDRDHTTVLHAVRKVEKMLETDITLKKEVELLKRLISE